MIIKKLFNRFKKKTKQTHLEQIPWRDVVDECYDKGLEFTYPIVKVIYADNKSERAVILNRPDMTYTVVFQKLYPFDEEELKHFSVGLHGYWAPSEQDTGNVFDTEEHATNSVFSTPPFKYNKCVVWAETPFRIDTERLHWIIDNGEDDPNDLCVHGQTIVKIGEEVFDYDATVSAAGLYLLRTLTEDHIVPEYNYMLPCCGHWMYINGDISTVNIGGCPNGVDWSVIHEGDKVKFVTETGKETFMNIEDYKNEVFSFTDKIEAYYNGCLPKKPFDKHSSDGYTAFWNEWRRRKQ